MSFIRVGKPSGGVRRKRSGAKKKPVWDDTIHDLSVHKASLEDQMYRKLIHESKNSLKARLEKMEKNQKKAKSTKPTARQMAVMKEILYDQQQLHDALSKSDHMMSVVQDIFGDNPKRFTGFPSVTVAPGSEDTSHLVLSDPDVRTQLETLSQSIMDGTALNESTDEEGDSDEAAEPVTYQPRLNLDRFHQFLAAAQEQNGTLSTISGVGVVAQGNEPGPAHSTKLPEGSAASRDGSIFETPPQRSTTSRTKSPKSAANDTAKISRSRKHVTTEIEGTGKALSLEDLKQVLVGLQSEITELEQQTGCCQETGHTHGDSFSGYTMALVNSVRRLTRHLKETERRLQAEMTIREQLTQDVVQLGTVVDALTSDIILTQEEYSKVVTEFERYKAETKTEMQNIKAMLQKVSSGTQNEANPPPPKERTCPVPPQELRTPPRVAHETQADQGLYAGSREALMSHHLIQPSDRLQPAILLSPPVQRTRLPDSRHLSKPPAPPTSVESIEHLKEMTGTENGLRAKELLPPEQPAQPTAVVNVPRPVPLVQTNIPIGYIHSDHGSEQTDEFQRLVDSALSQQAMKTSQPSVPVYHPIAIVQPPSHSSHPIMHGFTQAPSSHPTSESIPVSIGNSASAFKSVSSHSTESLSGQSDPKSVISVGQKGQQTQTHLRNEAQNTNGNCNVKNSAKVGPENPLLSAQIAELNRQHEEAQRRLQTMLQQQQSLRIRSDQPEKQTNVPLHTTHASVKQTNAFVDQVSPDVSPISERSSSVRGCLPAHQRAEQRGPGSQKAGPAGCKPQRITVSVPTMELDLSGFSDVSPSPQITQLTGVCQ